MHPLFSLFHLPLSNLCTQTHTQTHDVHTLPIKFFSFVSQVTAGLLGCLFHPNSFCHCWVFSFLFSLTHKIKKHSHFFQSLQYTGHMQFTTILQFLHHSWGYNSLLTPGAVVSAAASTRHSVSFPSLFLVTNFLSACTKFTLLASLLWSKMNSTTTSCQRRGIRFLTHRGNPGRKKTYALRITFGNIHIKTP